MKPETIWVNGALYKLEFDSDPYDQQKIAKEHTDVPSYKLGNANYPKENQNGETQNSIR